MLDFWITWLPQLLDGLRLSVLVTATSLAFGLPLGLALALGTATTNAPLR